VFFLISESAMRRRQPGKAEPRLAIHANGRSGKGDDVEKNSSPHGVFSEWRSPPKQVGGRKRWEGEPSEPDDIRADIAGGDVTEQG
jgi:hypothetical protein